MARDTSQITASEANDARQRALEIEEEKKIAQKNRVKNSQRKTKRVPKNAQAPIKERLIAPLLLLITLLLSAVVWLFSK